MSSAFASSTTLACSAALISLRFQIHQLVSYGLFVPVRPGFRGRDNASSNLRDIETCEYAVIVGSAQHGLCCILRRGMGGAL